ncbi:ABC transporter ATP-binding protein [Thalassospira sp.]|uniref:ABC transporter ATP-binding protein n=1 Tax=Thalassospira sp. TaxID=1912094 RepID=UPI000C5FC3C5|nr:ABC transporter ATP-binding protein [Thalassospira sp.]MBC04884.1 hypothetical protein [Thalassospira sp.]
MLKEFFSYYLPHKRLFLLDFGCAVLSGLLSLGFPVAVAGFVDTLLPKQDWILILLAALGLLIVYLINTGLMAVVTYWGHVLGITIETEMRRRAFDHLQKLSFRFYDNQKTGHLVARVTKDLEEIGEVAHHGPEDLFVAIMTFVGALILMFTVHTPLALIAMTIAPLVMWLVVRFGGDMTRNWQNQFGRVRAFNARIEENVGGVRVVRAFANEDHERALFQRDNEQYRSVKLQAYAIMAISLAINYLGMRIVQVVILIAGTLRDNIAYGRLDASEDEILAAAKSARLDDLIASLPAGLDTVIGERGVKLSGGQKQRVAIARIFLKNPPILILDEATSALDTETEQAIQQSLDDLAKGRTTLVIAHRLATIRNADRIVVITQDGIAEQGSHDALLARDGAYRRLHEAQALRTG